MHDIDRTQWEAEESEYAFGGELEEGELEVPMDETEELELASSLLEVESEEELEQFLGDVFRVAARSAGRLARSETGRALGAILQDTVARAVPIVRGTLGGAVGPGPGGAQGGTLAEQAGSLLGLELEGLSPQDQELESARQLVRLASNAYRRAARAPRNVPPRVVARRAVIAAARRHAPGLVRIFGRRPGYYRPGGQARPPAYGYRYGRPALPYAPYRAWAPRRRRRYPWRYPRPGYAYPAYGPAYGVPAGGEDEPAPYAPPDGFGEPAPFGEPAAVAELVPFAEPAPIVEPPPAGEPGGAAQPATAGELFSGWAPPGGAGYPRGRAGRWVRRGRVLILYGV
jgi:hypothetical protein